MRDRPEHIVHRFEARLLDPHLDEAPDEAPVDDRRPAERLPVRVGSAVRPRRDLGPWRIAIDTERPRVALLEAQKHRVGGEDPLRLAAEKIRLPDPRSTRAGRGVEELLDLGQRDLARPGGAARAEHQPGAERDGAEQHERQRDRDPGPAEQSDRRYRRAAREGAARKRHLQPAQAVAQLGCRGIATIRRLLEAAFDDRDELLRERTSLRCDGRRRVLENRRERRHGVAALERVPARSHLVEQDSEREEVGARVDRESLGLLGRHVGHGAEQMPGARDAVGGEGLGARVDGLGELGESEIEDLDAALAVEHHVGRFEVAVNDPIGVGAGERVGERDGDRQQLIERKAAGGDGAREGAALDQLHGEKVEAAVFFDGMQGDDVGVFQAGDDGRFAFEAGSSLRVVRDLGRQHLDRHIAAQAAVVPAIDVTHPSGAELLENVVVREPCTDQDACLLRCRPPAKSAGPPLTVSVMAIRWRV